MPKVSVITPVYMAEPFIERCARSLFEQSFADIEYIFVDDCSPDNSMVILQRVLCEYPTRKSQVKIIRHNNNTGVAIARKEALCIASGDYIAHCDSDDWIERNAIEEVYATAVKDNADMVLFDYYETDGSVHVRRSTIKGDFPMETNSKRDFLLQKGGCPYLWTRLFKRELLHNSELVWPTGNISEDWTLCVELTHLSKIIKYISNPYYFYYYNSNSITMNRSESNLLNRQKGNAENAECLESFFKMIDQESAGEESIFALKMQSKWQLGSLVGKKMYYQQWKACYPEVNALSLIQHHYSVNAIICYMLQFFRIYPFLKTHFGNRR